jgi:NTE family protein
MTRTAFVLGGGGVLGAAEVGMVRALLEHDITPDLVLGTSVGALNGSLLAATPRSDVVDRLTALWKAAASGRQVYGDRAHRRLTRAMRT